MSFLWCTQSSFAPIFFSFYAFSKNSLNICSKTPKHPGENTLFWRSGNHFVIFVQRHSFLPNSLFSRINSVLEPSFTSKVNVNGIEFPNSFQRAHMKRCRSEERSESLGVDCTTHSLFLGTSAQNHRNFRGQDAVKKVPVSYNVRCYVKMWLVYCWILIFFFVSFLGAWSFWPWYNGLVNKYK